MAFSDLVKHTAADAGITQLGYFTKGISQFAHDFTPQTAQRYAGVAVPVYSLSASDFDASTNNWCDGDDVGGLVVTLDYHSIAGISLPDTGVSLSGNYAGCAYGEQDMTVNQIVRDATVGIVKAIEEQIATNIYGKFLTSNVAVSAKTAPAVSADATAWAEAIGDAVTAGAITDPTKAVMLVTPELFYGFYAAAAKDHVVFPEQEALKYGMIENVFGLKAVVMAKSLGGGAVKAALVQEDAFGIVSRANRPAINGYWDTFEIRTEDGFQIGFRAFEHLCQGALKFAGDALYGAKFLQLDANGKAKGIQLYT